MSKYKEHVEVVPIDYTYSFGNQKHAKTNRNKVQDLLRDVNTIFDFFA